MIKLTKIKCTQGRSEVTPCECSSRHNTACWVMPSTRTSIRVLLFMYVTGMQKMGKVCPIRAGLALSERSASGLHANLMQCEHPMSTE